MKPVNSLAVVERGAFKGWRWLGTTEKRFVKPPELSREADLLAKRYYVIEVRDVNDRRALAQPPVADGDLKMWIDKIDPAFEVPLLDTSQSLVGVDHELTMIGDGRQGLGVTDSLLIPTASLITLLNLQPGVPFSYEDKDGLGLALVTWRAEYDTSDYYLAWPRTCGAGIVIRPDLLAKLIATAGEHRLVLRDFVVGDLKLLSKLTT
jgi:hypothetical protein